MRHFVINQSKSPFQAVLGPGFTITLGGFQGQSNDGEVGPAFLDLEAGQPDPVTGLATINVVAASDFIFADARSFAPIYLCLKPIVPAPAAGLVACNGGFPFGFSTSVNHNIGQVGVNGFTADDCHAMNGQIESPNQICAAGLIGNTCHANADCDTTAGAGDGVCGLGPATCTRGTPGAACQADADCDTTPDALDGVCGQVGAYPGVCNGPMMFGQLPGDTGPGSVVIAPFNQEGIMLNGLPMRLSIQSGPPCVDPGPGAQIAFAFTTGVSRSTIMNFSNMPDQTVTFDARGQNFSCADWQDVTGPGRLALSAAALNQNPGGGDVITAFTFDGSGPNPTPTTAAQ